MSYATIEDVQSRMIRDLTEDEQTVCTNLLDDAGIIIDSFNAAASADAKLTVSCRMVIRALGSGDDTTPVGATQGRMSALNYSQSWTMGNGSTGELYLSKIEKQILGVGNKIGSYSPVQELAVKTDD